MLSDAIKDKLKASWGEKASAMACMAYVRVFDPYSPWECYIYAMNPEDEDEICCIIKAFSVEVAEWRMSDLMLSYNAHGEPLQLDEEYVPRRAAELFKKLSEPKKYERN